MKVDTAVLQALSLDSAKTTISTHGGSSFSSTMKIASVLLPDKNGTQIQKNFFMKTGTGKDAENMFAGEHASLNALHFTVPSLSPQSFAHGRLVDSPGGGGAFLVTDFLDMRSTASSHSLANEGSGLSLAAKLAHLHTTPAPIPEGLSKPMFGFPVSTCCGSTEQENGFLEEWADFYAERRLMFILREGERKQGKDGSLRGMVERVVGEVVPRLLGRDRLNGGRGPEPVVVHGDVGFPHAGLNGPFTELVFVTAMERQ